MLPFTRNSRKSSPVALNGRAVQLRVRTRYDTAQTTDDNRKHWANADAYSADAANTPVVRRTLRNRARYEVANNSFAHRTSGLRTRRPDPRAGFSSVSAVASPSPTRGRHRA